VTTPNSGSRSTRMPWIRFAALGVALFSLAACGVERQPTEYGDAYEENFMLGCTGVDKDGLVPNGGEKLSSESYCGCVYEGLVETVPFEEATSFEETQSEAESGADIKVPENIQSVFDGCGNA